MDLYALPDPLRRQVEEELEPGETVRWLGQPEPQGFVWAALFPFLFAIPWTLFSLVWMMAAAGVLPGFAGPAPVPGAIQMDRLGFASFGIPFVLIGIGMLTSPWWIRRSLRRRAENSAYVITDRRAIVFDAGYTDSASSHLDNLMIFDPLPFLPLLLFRNEMRIRSFRADDLNSLERVQRKDGSGDVIIQRGRRAFWMPFPGAMAAPPAGFFSIPNVRDVERQLRALRESADVPTV